MIELADIRGDLHCHTIASDGHDTIEEMALRPRASAATSTWRSPTTPPAMALATTSPPTRCERQIELVHEANGRIEGIELLAGSEVNMLPDGSLDYEDELLAGLDWVIASVHTSFAMGEQKMSERMIAAIEHPYVHAIGHPTAA